MKDIWLAIIPATIPTLAVLIGILLNQYGISRLDKRGDRIEDSIDRLEAKLEGRIVSLETKVDTRVDALSRQINDGIVMLVGRDTDKVERLARLEERSKS